MSSLRADEKRLRAELDAVTTERKRRDAIAQARRSVLADIERLETERTARATRIEAIGAEVETLTQRLADLTAQLETFDRRQA